MLDGAARSKVKRSDRLVCLFVFVVLNKTKQAGMDQSFDSSGNGFDTSKMYPAMADGLINNSWVDRACEKVLTQKFAVRIIHYHISL